MLLPRAVADDLYRRQVIVTGQGEAERARLRAVLPEASSPASIMTTAGRPSSSMTSKGRGPSTSPSLLTGRRSMRRSTLLVSRSGRSRGRASTSSAACATRPPPMSWRRGSGSGNRLRWRRQSAASPCFCRRRRCSPPGASPTVGSPRWRPCAGALLPERPVAMPCLPARWSEAALGWTAHWHLSWQGREYRWHNRGVFLDDAFRNAVDRAVPCCRTLGQRRRRRRTFAPRRQAV